MSNGTSVTSWTATGGVSATNAADYSAANLFPQNPNGGSNFADLSGNNASTQQGTLSQSITTVIGQKYTLSFWVANDASASPSSLTATLGSNSLLVDTSAMPDGSNNGSSSALYQLFMLAPFTATSTSTLLSFTYQTDYNWALDDVSVVLMASGPTGAPEMDARGSLPALALSCFLIGLLADQRRKNLETES